VSPSELRSAETSTVPLRKSRPLAIAWPITSPDLAGPGRSQRCLVALIAWTAFNSGVRTWQVELFDPYRYIFINLILSTLATLQAPIILMSQNRQAARDRLAAGLDYEVNLKAEIEIIDLHKKLGRILGEHLDELLRTRRERLQLLTQLAQANSNAPSGM
jgi:uncharacterized membrane protein